MQASRISRIGLSPTMAVNARAREMRAQGIDVIDMSVGEPDFPTPEFIKDAARRALDAGMTRYTSIEGTLDLRQAICRKFERDDGVHYEPEEIMVSAGAKQCLFNAIFALVDDGDEVIVPGPYFVSYTAQVALAGGRSIVVPCREEDDFLLNPKDLEQAITARTKALFLCNPSNPTGSAYPRDELRAVCEMAARKGVIILSDEIYEKILYDGFEHTCVAAISDEVKAHSVVINGVSKSYAMTGWRLGYAAAPRDLIKSMTKLQSHSTSNANSLTQAAAVAALDGPQEEIAAMVTEFKSRRDYVLKRLDALPGVSCRPGRGTFYLFPNVRRFLEEAGSKDKPWTTSSDLALYLLNEAKVAVVPGEAFGAEGFLRLSYATSQANLARALDRIEEAMTAT